MLLPSHLFSMGLCKVVRRPGAHIPENHHSSTSHPPSPPPLGERETLGGYLVGYSGQRSGNGVGLGIPSSPVSAPHLFNVVTGNLKSHLSRSSLEFFLTSRPPCSGLEPQSGAPLSRGPDRLQGSLGVLQSHWPWFRSQLQTAFCLLGTLLRPLQFLLPGYCSSWLLLGLSSE